MEIIKRKKGTVFRVRLFLPSGRSVSKTFKSKTDAKSWRSQIRFEIQKQRALGITPPEDIAVKELVTKWLEHKILITKSKRTYQNYKSDSHVHIVPALEDFKASQINIYHIDEIVRKMRMQDYSNRTINKIITRLKQILNYAIEQNHLIRNPVSKYPELKETLKKDVYLTRNEISQLLRTNLREEIYPVLVIALNTGMRIGELMGLCWDRVNFDSSQIEVSRILTREGLLPTTKTNQKRFVPMNTEVQRVLAILFKQQRSNTFVFVKDNGKPFDINHVSQRDFKKALARAEIPLNFRFHDLRHTYASHFMMNAGNMYDLQKILGHTRVEMTQRYAHLSPSHLAIAAEVVNFSIERSACDVPQTDHIRLVE
jgi:integrase